MRESIGLTTLFKAIIIFTLIFASFIAIAITYNKAFKIKNEAMRIIEKYEGVNTQSLMIINNYLKTSGYRTMNRCADDEFGVKDLDSNTYEESSSSEEYYYCLSNTKKDGKIYYRVKLFFRFNIPFLGDLLTFNITGETKGIRMYNGNVGL